jgi:inosine-uridine nucleoside N-ribohydrolase
MDILGITVVDGIAHVEPGLENIRRLLATTGREDIPIAAGSPTPMVGENTFSRLDRLIVDSILRPALPKLATMTSTTAAPDLIRQLVADSPTPVNIIALGPLTNIAQALHDDPALASRLNTVVISGGTIGDSGTIMAPPARTPLSDWNMLLDPQAADMVFRSGAPLTVIPLDVTNPHGSSPILVSEDFVARFKAKARGQESQLMAHVMDGWLLVHPGTDAVPLWDAVVVAIAVDTNVCTDWRDLSIHITLEPAEPGQTVVDKNAPPNARACLGGDQNAFDEAYLATAR